MPLVRLNKTPSGRQLLVFALGWAVFFGAAAISCWDRSWHGVAAGLALLSIGLPVAGMIQRKILRYAYIGLSYATFPVGFVVSYLVLALMYFAVLAPIGLVMRLLGHDPLARRFDRSAATYWLPRERSRAAKTYFKQD
jgi:Saxitoxin biosynthesis operon protein SxtJ